MQFTEVSYVIKFQTST